MKKAMIEKKLENELKQGSESAFNISFITGERGMSDATTFISANQTKNIDLKDGSSITLCAGSKIELADNFNKQRDVNLLGKASFEVKHIDKPPFSVDADNIYIKVTRISINKLSCQEINHNQYRLFRKHQ